MKTTASVYDPAQRGINGNPNATPCGVRVSELPWSIAHKIAPCGSIVTITHGDQILQVPVADRGPYIPGRDIDMRPEVAAAIGSTGLIDVNYAISTHRISLKEMAQAGGNAAAFEKVSGLVANSKDKKGQATDAQFQKDNPGGITNLADKATGGAVSAAESIGGAVSSLITALFDPSTYFRIGKGLLGGVLIVLGVGGLVFMVANKVSNSGSASGVKKMATVAATVVK